MSKFCIHCRKQLEEGQECDCQAGTGVTGNPSAAQQQTYVPANLPQNNNDFVGFIKDEFKFGVEFFKDPVGHIKSVAQSEDYKAGLFFLTIQALAIGILVLILTKQAAEFFSDLLGPLSGLVDMVGYYSKDIPYFSIFIKVFFAVVIQFFVLAGIAYGLGKLAFKGEGSFKGVMATMGVATIPMTAVAIASMIIAFVFPSILSLLITFGTTIMLLLQFVGIREALKFSEVKAIYLIPTSYIIYVFVLLKIAEEMNKSAVKRFFE